MRTDGYSLIHHCNHCSVSNVSQGNQHVEQLYTNLTQIYRSLESVDCPIHTWDYILVYVAVQLLDPESFKEWERQLGSTKDLPTWQQHIEFLISRHLTLQSYENSSGKKGSTPLQPTKVKTHFQGKLTESKPKQIYNCTICLDSHYTAWCPQFNSKTVKQKLALLNQHQLCYNCLDNHKIVKCRNPKRCQKCGRRHHTSIHPDKPQTTANTSTKTEQDTPIATTSKTDSTSVNAVNVHHTTTRYVLLATAQVTVIVANGNCAQARALIDQGSEISLISERLAQQLKMSRKQSSIPLIGVGALTLNKTKGLIECQIQPHFESSFNIKVIAHVLNKLTASIPSRLIDPSS